MDGIENLPEDVQDWLAKTGWQNKHRDSTFTREVFEHWKTTPKTALEGYPDMRTLVNLTSDLASLFYKDHPDDVYPVSTLMFETALKWGLLEGVIPTHYRA